MIPASRAYYNKLSIEFLVCWQLTLFFLFLGSVYIIIKFILKRSRCHSDYPEPLGIAIYQQTRFNEYCFCLYRVLKALLHRCANSQASQNYMDKLILKNVKLKLSEIVISEINDLRVADAFRSLKW